MYVCPHSLHGLDMVGKPCITVNDNKFGLPLEQSLLFIIRHYKMFLNFQSFAIHVTNMKMK